MSIQYCSGYRAVCVLYLCVIVAENSLPTRAHSRFTVITYRPENQRSQFYGVNNGLLQMCLCIHFGSVWYVHARRHAFINARTHARRHSSTVCTLAVMKNSHFRCLSSINFSASKSTRKRESHSCSPMLRSRTLSRMGSAGNPPCTAHTNTH